MSEERSRIIGLAGNPNVGKSTVFNALTGMKQHTGNWAGKTVESARGSYKFNGKNYILTDVPGTYSLSANSAEEEVARDFICFGEADAVVIVADATCLERNLNFIIQVLETGIPAVVCLNLMDEAEKKGIRPDPDELSLYLGVPVVASTARKGHGMKELMGQIEKVSDKNYKSYYRPIRYGQVTEREADTLARCIEPYLGPSINPRWLSLKLLEGEKGITEGAGSCDDLLAVESVRETYKACLARVEAAGIDEIALREEITNGIFARCDKIFKRCVFTEKTSASERDRRIDAILTSPVTGIPIMLAGVGIALWITMAGANYPSQMLSNLFEKLGDALEAGLAALGATGMVKEILIDGVYKTLSWVVSVMLPPMAIFFPLFTLLEDFGYLPRVAFNLDRFFKKAGAHGKQALTMCMGFGCNACGVTGCRIIDSPRERLIGILTNNFVPCNGRFPIMISIITMFFTVGIKEPVGSLVSAAILMGVIILGVCTTFLMSRLLSATFLKGKPSAFALELPPYRPPQIGQVIIRSVFDRTIFVLGRAIAVAAPAGLIIWLLANLQAGNGSVIVKITDFLNPFARIIGLDGVILLAFILALPANEIVMPIILMVYMSSGSLAESGNLLMVRQLLVENGWTWITALCTVVFSLFHFPCATTLWTVAKETKSIKWTLLAFALPTVVGIIACFAIASVGRIIAG